ncbi:MAG: winged helix-turn-helix transcriptional regulator [Bacteroidaceae bacterium]|nr:winged helix-turn-helix transcriptional regulator [Bacteroidaceae bacterium]MBR1940317.1 winged helix-turn-helix transcriptional regulator [Bacteroidaceae bacterium]
MRYLSLAEERKKKTKKLSLFCSERTMSGFLAPTKTRVKQKSREKKPKSREKILELLAENPKLTIAGLSAAIGIGAKAVEKQLAKLRADGRLRRVGPAKGGHWELN